MDKELIANGIPRTIIEPANRYEESTAKLMVETFMAGDTDGWTAEIEPNGRWYRVAVYDEEGEIAGFL